jgi:hypothetical protein
MSNSTPKATPQKTVADSKTLYLRLFSYAWKYKGVFLIGILGLVFLSATNTAFLATIKQVTTYVIWLNGCAWPVRIFFWLRYAMGGATCS